MSTSSSAKKSSKTHPCHPMPFDRRLIGKPSRADQLGQLARSRISTPLPSRPHYLAYGPDGQALGGSDRIEDAFAAMKRGQYGSIVVRASDGVVLAASVPKVVVTPEKHSGRPVNYGLGEFEFA